MLYYWAVITLGGDHGHMIYTYTVTLLMILFGDGGGRGRWLHPDRGGPEFLKAPDGYFVAERQGRLRPPRREVGLALVGVRGYFRITRLTRSWYLI